MAKALKAQGLVELNLLLARTRRQYALGRIAKPDHDYIERRLLEVKQRIEQMAETDERGQELSANTHNPAQDERN